ncbi:SDR family NAD(P)-dependent oxidoreductase [Rhodovarius crocodyli]|uniref:SDR family NAD(P)-dependent oxidoreductase n=1 Tax=Rhodovarius crocodyli TaxID=1979269 RepID=A0A437MNJ6_9PROT|nr:SDR family NAD(P)-dependent oxidoreductase [Rhodovarius crocodyli]RVT99218.1 SDR family NAD(P)-dependent oxidoreductase [Rhodovarius crocodyli]
MRVLITGSAGFIGFHLARRLLAKGHTVAGIDNMNAYYDVALKQARHAILSEDPRFTPHVLDITDRPALEAVVDGLRPELVVHLAAQAGVRHALKAPEDYVSSNIQGSFHVLEACRKHPPAHLLMASTSSVYGATDKLPFREDDQADTALNIYAASKRSMEVMAHSHAHLWKLPVTCFRFFTVYGPWGRPDMALFRFTRAILAGEPIEVYGHGRMARDFTYVDDLVEAITRLAAHPPVEGHQVGEMDSLSPVAPFRVVNIGGGNPVQLMDFIAAVESALGRQAEKLYRDRQPGEVETTWAEPALLRALTGEVPETPVTRGVQEFVAWYREFYGA